MSEKPLTLTPEDRERFDAKYKTGAAALSRDRLDAEKERIALEKEASNESERRALAIHFSGKIITSKTLIEKDFGEPDFLIPGLIPEGLTILAGSPKIGKSWLALQLAVALSSGGHVFGTMKVQRKKVLYLALEDTARRLSSRLKKIKAPASDFLDVSTEWYNGEKAIIEIRKYKKYSPETEVVIIDTLQSFRGLTDQSYSQDYVDLSAIRSLCDELKISIILIHHTRKMEAIDPVQEIAGTNGVSGVADTILVMKRERKKREATLFLTSRDIEESETVLSFDPEIGSWSIIGDADFVRLTAERQEIIEAIDELGETTTGKVAQFLGKKIPSVSNLLKRLADDGFVRKAGYGVWAPLKPGETDETDETGEEVDR